MLTVNTSDWRDLLEQVSDIKNMVTALQSRTVIPDALSDDQASMLSDGETRRSRALSSVRVILPVDNPKKYIPCVDEAGFYRFEAILKRGGENNFVERVKEHVLVGILPGSTAVNEMGSKLCTPELQCFMRGGENQVAGYLLY